MTTAGLEELVTLSELSELAKRSPATLRADITHGRLHAVKIGQGWRVPVSEARRYLSGESADCNGKGN